MTAEANNTGRKPWPPEGVHVDLVTNDPAGHDQLIIDFEQALERICPAAAPGDVIDYFLTGPEPLIGEGVPADAGTVAALEGLTRQVLGMAAERFGLQLQPKTEQSNG